MARVRAHERRPHPWVEPLREGGAETTKWTDADRQALLDAAHDIAIMTVVVGLSPHQHDVETFRTLVAKRDASFRVRDDSLLDANLGEAFSDDPAGGDL